MTAMSEKTEYAVTADGCIVNAAGAIIGHAGNESDGWDIAAELNFVAAERDELKDKLTEAERERDGWREASRKNADLAVDNAKDVIAVTACHDEWKARAEVAQESLNKILIEFGNAHSIRLIVQGKAAAEAREAALREALENIDWHIRNGMPVGSFAKVAREAIDAAMSAQEGGAK